MIRVVLFVVLLFGCQEKKFDSSIEISDLKIDLLFKFISSENYVYESFFDSLGFEHIQFFSTSINLRKNASMVTKPMYHNTVYKSNDTIIVHKGNSNSVIEMFVLNRENQTILIHSGSMFHPYNKNKDSFYIMQLPANDSTFLWPEISIEKKPKVELKLIQVNSNYYEVT